MDTEAFKKRVVPVRSKLFRFALRLLGSEEEAKDVVQEVLIRIWSGREKMEEVQNWEAWCMRITKNLSFDLLRKNTRRKTHPLSAGENILEEAMTPHEKTEMQENMQQLTNLIESLPPKQQQVIHLRDVEGYSYNEICEILQLDMNQVKVNLFRARHAVREKLVKINAYGL